MPLRDLVGFASTPLFFSYWLWITGRAAFRTSEFLESSLGRQMVPGIPADRVRRASLILFGVGVLFVALMAWDLFNGTFRWRGSPRQYGFWDLLP